MFWSYFQYSWWLVQVCWEAHRIRRFVGQNLVFWGNIIYVCMYIQGHYYLCLYVHPTYGLNHFFCSEVMGEEEHPCPMNTFFFCFFVFVFFDYIFIACIWLFHLFQVQFSFLHLICNKVSYDSQWHPLFSFFRQDSARMLLKVVSYGMILWQKDMAMKLQCGSIFISLRGLFCQIFWLNI